MFIKYVKFKFRRNVRRLKALPQEIYNNSLSYIDANIVKKWRKFKKVRFFVVEWAGLAALMVAATFIQLQWSQGAAMRRVPTEGGVYREAVVGRFNNASPLFAVDGPNADVANLIFDSLLEYDEQGKLVTSLAGSITASDDAETFTVKLRDNVLWHDGEAFDAQDIAFTIELLQDPDVNSPFIETWQGVQVDTPDELTVVFTLPNAFAPFPHLLTQGIVPHHILSSVERTSMRAHPFSRQPVGTGPYRLRSISADTNLLSLNRYIDYFRGTPYIRTIEIELFNEVDSAQQAFNKGLVDGFGRQIQGAATEEETQEPTKLAAASYLFFNTKTPGLSSQDVRQAMVKLVDDSALFDEETFIAPQVTNPFLPQQLSVSKKEQTQFKQDVAGASSQLDEAGFKRSTDGGIRAKAATQLSFRLLAADTAQHRLVSARLAEVYREAGIELQVEHVSVEEFQNRVVASKDYDLVLATIQNGLDLDNYVFWHSSQAGPGGLNFARLEDKIIDTALESGRTRTDRKLRIAKYETFLERWRTQAPAVALYQELYNYQQLNRVRGFNSEVLAQPNDRFNAVHSWYVRTESVLNNNR